MESPGNSLSTAYRLLKLRRRKVPDMSCIESRCGWSRLYIYIREGVTRLQLPTSSARIHRNRDIRVIEFSSMILDASSVIVFGDPGKLITLERTQSCSRVRQLTSGIESLRYWSVSFRSTINFFSTGFFFFFSLFFITLPCTLFARQIPSRALGNVFFQRLWSPCLSCTWWSILICRWIRVESIRETRWMQVRV